MTITISIRYFAFLQEKRQLEHEQLSIEPMTVVQCFRELSQKYQFGLNEDQLLWAVNNEYVSPDYLLRENDELVFIPPVSGG